MREHKYRAWDDINKQMLEHRQIGILLKNINNKPSGKKQWYFMEYTGLKNFCEGDIHYLKLNGIETHIEYQYAVIEYNVEWCAFFYKVSDKSSYNQLSLRDKNILNREPKGNVYQNKELLNE